MGPCALHHQGTHSTSGVRTSSSRMRVRGLNSRRPRATSRGAAPCWSCSCCAPCCGGADAAAAAGASVAALRAATMPHRGRASDTLHGEMGLRTARPRASPASRPAAALSLTALAARRCSARGSIVRILRVQTNVLKDFKIIIGAVNCPPVISAQRRSPGRSSWCLARPAMPRGYAFKHLAVHVPINRAYVYV